MKELRQSVAKHQSAILELGLWYLPLIVLIALGAWLRFTELGHDLPSDADNDELYYYFWANDVRATGYPISHNGSGYPPGFLYLYAAELPIVEFIRGPQIDRSVDYFLFARSINGLFGLGCIGLAGLFARNLSHSRLAGLLAAGFVALHNLPVQESRLAAANAPWLFFSLLAFLLLFKAPSANQVRWLYAALIAGVISFLFKYQSGMFFMSFFLYSLVMWQRGRLKLRHVVIWAIGLLALLLWLLFVYHIAEIVHTPATDTGSAISGGQLRGLQSWYGNWLLLKQQLAGDGLVWIALATCLWAGWSLARPRTPKLFEELDVLAVGVFLVLYYGLMAFFQIAALARLVSNYIPLNRSQWGSATLIALNGLVFWSFGPSVWWAQLADWQTVYETNWSRPYSVNALNRWFANQVPQGGRAMIKANKILNSYLFPPTTFHSDTIPDLFDSSIADYQRSGYDYLIWNDLGSNASSSREYLNKNIPSFRAQGAEVVLSLEGPAYWGPTIIVFQLPPFQQHPLYAWFSQDISFRGYDLNGQTFKPGDTLQLMLYWESVNAVSANNIVFVHLSDAASGKLIAGQDGPPDYGNTPTWKWQGDMQLIRDQRTLTIPADAKAGDHVLSIGMYDAETQVRVPVADARNQPIGDSLDLQRVRVQP